MPALRNDAGVSLAREQSHELEQLRRLQRSMLHVIIYGASRVLSSGLKQHLRGVAQMMEAGHPAALRLALEQLRWTAIIAEVSAASAIAPSARASQVPLLLLAFDPAQVRAAHTAGVAAVLLAHDPALCERLAATLSAIALGEPVPLFPPPIAAEIDDRPDVPPAIVDHFTALEISPREIDVIWLSAQGLDNEAIAQALGITETTVNSHWRNIGAPRGLTRKQARGWAREEVRRVKVGNALCVVQTHDLALIVAERVLSVAHRGRDGAWRYAITLVRRDAPGAQPERAGDEPVGDATPDRC